jgi:HEAT repeat protein
MNGSTPILITAGLMLAVGLLSVLAWFIYGIYLDRIEHRLARRKGLYRDLVSELATRERALLEPTINQIRALYDIDAFEAVLEEQARMASERPAWLLEVYDQLGLVDKYVDKLRNARKWRDRAFAAELLGRVGGAKVVPPLLETVQATQSEDSDVREIALRALARIADPAAVEPLVTALESADAWLAPRIADILGRHGDAAIDPLLPVLADSPRSSARAWAANVLGEVRAARAFPALLRALGDLDDEVRSKAATALGRLGDHRAVAPLLEHLLSDRAPFVRARVASALAQFGGPEVINRLIPSLGDSAWWVRLRAIEALEQIGSLAEGPLLVALDDTDPELRQRAAIALERLGVPSGLTGTIERGDPDGTAARTLSLLVSAGSREQISELLVHPAQAVRELVVTALRRQRRSDAAPELTRVASRDPSASTRALALETLRVLHIHAAAPAAVAALTEENPAVRVAAIRFLGAMGGEEALRQIRVQATDSTPEVRAAAAEALGALGGRRVEPELMRLIADPEPEVRKAGLRGIVAAGLPVTASIISPAMHDTDPRVVEAAVHAAAQAGDSSVVPLLLEAFVPAGPELQYRIVLAVSQLQPDSVADLVNVLLHREDAESRLSLARTLGRLQWSDGIEHLSRLAGDTDDRVRLAAIEALGRLARLHGPIPEIVAQAVSAALSDTSASVRAAAADVSGRIQLREQGARLVQLLELDPVPQVRERAAIAVGLLRVQGAEQALITACQRAQPAAVRAAAALAAGIFNRDSLIPLMLEMPDEAMVRQLLRERLKRDPWFRLLGLKLPPASQVELRALAAAPGHDQAVLAGGMQQVLHAGERVRLITALRAFQGEPSRTALLQTVQADPSPDVRTAALTSVAQLLEPDELLSFGSRALGDPNVMVRRAAVGLFVRVAPERALSRLIMALQLDEDPAVLGAVADFAERSFEAFRSAVLDIPLENRRAGLVARICRHLHHPDLAGVLAFISRSGNPDVRETVADVWQHRPDANDAFALEALTADPVVSVRLIAAAAAASAQRYDLLDRMTRDPDPSVRREIAMVVGRAGHGSSAAVSVLQRLGVDSQMIVRAAAHVGQLLQGIPVPLPPGLDPVIAAEAVRDTGELENLRQIARSSSAEDHRLAAALALALIQDDVAKEVARSDPAPPVRHRVGGALELALPGSSGESR